MLAPRLRLSTFLSDQGRIVSREKWEQTVTTAVACLRPGADATWAAVAVLSYGQEAIPSTRPPRLAAVWCQTAIPAGFIVAFDNRSEK